MKIQGLKLLHFGTGVQKYSISRFYQYMKMLTEKL